MSFLLTGCRLAVTGTDGKPLAGGWVTTYAAGTTTPKVCYSNSTNTVPHSNPFQLDAYGQADVWLSGMYKILIQDSSFVTLPGYPVDDIPGADNTGADNISESFENIAALRLNTNPIIAVSNTLGRDSKGDKGASPFWKDASDVTTPDDGLLCIVDARGGRWKLNHGGTITHEQAGVLTGNTAAVNTPRLQYAVNAAIANGFELVGGYGTYNINDNIIINGPIKWRGESKTATIIRTSDLIKDIIKIDTGTNVVTGIHVSDIQLDATALKTGGSGINQTVTSGGTIYHSSFRRIAMSDKMAAGMRITSAFYLEIEEVEVSKVGQNQYGIMIQGLDATSKVANVWMRDCKVMSGTVGATTRGLHIGSFSEGIYVKGVTLESNGLNYGLWIRNTLSSRAKNLFFLQLVSDSSATTGILIDDGEAIKFNQCWSVSCAGGPGIRVISGTDIAFELGWLISNWQNGALIEASARQVRVKNSTIDANSQQTANTFSGVAVAANTADFEITGNTFYRGNGATKYHKYSVEVVAGTSDRYLVTQNNLFGYLTGALSDGGSGVNKVVTGNVT